MFLELTLQSVFAKFLYQCYNCFLYYFELFRYLLIFRENLVEQISKVAKEKSKR